MLKIILGMFSGLSGPLGSLVGAVLDKVIDAVWKRVEDKMNKNSAFVADSKEITAEASQLQEELAGAISAENTSELQAVLSKIRNFHGNISKR